MVVDVGLEPGVHKYQFIVDGRWRGAGQPRQERNSFGDINSLIEVKHNGRYEAVATTMSLRGKAMAILAYLSILCIFPLLLKRTTASSHSKQGVVLFVAEAAVFILHIILGVWFLKLGMFVLLTFSF